MPSVFISYSHDSDLHKHKVRDLSASLLSDGVDCTIDQYEAAPNKGWLQWMANQIRESEYVILVCTETYQKRIEGREEEGIGRGVKWEGMHILNLIYRSDCQNTKFIPIIFESKDRIFIPDALISFTQFDLSQKAEYKNLNMFLWGELALDKPLLGEKRNFSHNQETSYKFSQTQKIAEITEKISGVKIYELKKQQVEQIYVELDTLEGTSHASFANYLWVILYHEYCKRHMAPRNRESVSRKKTIGAMKHSLNDHEKTLIKRVIFQTNIQEQLNLLGKTK